MEPGSLPWHEAIESGAAGWHEAGPLMPHRLPARLIDFVALSDELGALGLTQVREHWPCLEAAGSCHVHLPPEACAELIAQTYAGIAGLRACSDPGHAESGAMRMGFLVGLRDFSFSGETIRPGDKLLICLGPSTDIGQVSLIHGTVYKNRLCVSAGQVKIYV